MSPGSSVDKDAGMPTHEEEDYIIIAVRKWTGEGVLKNLDK